MTLRVSSSSMRGFTLIEVLVAVVLMALLSATAYKGVATMLDARERIESAVASTQRMQQALSQWSDDWEAASQLRMHSGVFYSGSAVRMIRHDPLRVGRIVAWRQTSTGLERALMPPVESVEDLHQQLMASTEEWVLHGTLPRGATLTTWPDLSEFQIYYFVGNSWANPYSTFSDQQGWPSAVRLELKTPKGFISSDWLDLNAPGMHQ